MKKTKIMVLVLLLTALLLSGCSSADEYALSPAESPGSSMDYASDESLAYEEEKGVVNDSAGFDGNEGMVEPDKIITNISMAFETVDFDDTMDSLRSLVADKRGYISESNIHHGNQYYSEYYGPENYRRANLAIRIPRDNAEAFQSSAPGIANLVDESVSKVDVTKQYNDTESRMAVLDIKEERLLSLLDRAEEMEDIIALESELSNVIQEKERLKTTLIDLDDRIDYATFHVEIREVRKITPSETVETPFGEKVANAFADSWHRFARGVESFAIGMVYSLPTLLMVIMAFVVGWKLGKKFLVPMVNKYLKGKNGRQ